ncbi:MAG: dTDP-4-dehydrorhamnose 3,5-epimerase family protein [bacterium]|nr:dTDP-4-dehydrorhamnose 3,5-epimerase family protein [bacterium]
MIKVHQTTLPGVLQIERFAFEDHRGIYMEIYNEKGYFDAGIPVDFISVDSSSSHKNVLRGLHGDPKTWKLISCIYGELYLVVLNYDESSTHFGKWETFTLTPHNRLQILVPPMHANGHLIISDEAVFHYNQSEHYTDGKNQFTVKWNDPRFNILWPITNPILSERDGGIK